MKKGNAIRIEQFAYEMQTIMAEFQDLCKEALDEAVTETGEKVAKTVASKAPVGKTATRGEYARSITFGDKELYAKTVKGVVYAEKPHYRLTHLLENGHALIRNGKKVGRTGKFVHWEYGEIESKELLVKKLKEKIEK